MPITASEYWLPELETSYRVYKADTAHLANWLASQVSRLGVAVQRSSTSNISSNGRQSHGLKADQFRIFTDLIVQANNPRINIPRKIVTVAERAFIVRRQFTETLRKNLRQTDKGHDYFSSLIEEVYEKLKENCTALDKDASTLPGGSRAGLITSFHLLTTDTLNYSPSEEDEDRPDANAKQVPPIAARKNKSKKVRDREKKWRLAHPKADPELESGFDQSFYLEEDEDPYFVLMCLLADLLSMRKYIKEVWKEYKEEKVDLVTASLTSNASFDIIRTYESDFPAISALIGDYSKTMELILSRDLDQPNDEGLKLFFQSESTPSQLQIIGASLAKIPDVAELSFANAFYFLNGPRHQIVWRKPDGDMGINSTRNLFGQHHYGIDRAKLDYAQRLTEDISLLTWYAQIVYAGYELSDMDQDHFSRQWRDFRRTGDKTVTLAHAFGTQLYLDIAHVLGDELFHGYADLLTTCLETRKSIDLWEAKTPQHLYQNYTKLTGSRTVLPNLRENLATIFLQRDTYAMKMGELYDEVGNGDCYMRDDLSLLESNPLLCGIVEFQLIHPLRDSGVLLTSHWRTIISAGQLYYACRMHRNFWQGESSKDHERSQGTLESGIDQNWHNLTALHWDDMDYLFEMLGAEAFFEGHLPLSNYDLNTYNGAWKHEQISLGKDMELQHSKRYTPPLVPPLLGEMRKAQLQTGHEMIHWEPIAVTHRLYFSMYQPLERENSRTSWTENSLLALVECYLDFGANAKESTGVQSSSRVKKVSQVTLLSALKAALQAESRAFRFDFLSFHVRCFQMLRSLRNCILPRVKELLPNFLQSLDFPVGDVQTDEGILWLAPRLLKLASIQEIEADRWKIGKEPREKPPFSTSRVHTAIDEGIKEFLKDTQSQDAEINKIDTIWGIKKEEARSNTTET